MSKVQNGFTLLVGDVVSLNGYSFKVAEILYCENFWDGWMSFEFLDPSGNIHSARTTDGEITIHRKRALYDSAFHADCTDLFAKYGYKTGDKVFVLPQYEG